MTLLPLELTALIDEIENHVEWSRDEIIDFLKQKRTAEESAFQSIAEEERGGYWTKPGRWF